MNTVYLMLIIAVSIPTNKPIEVEGDVLAYKSLEDCYNDKDRVHKVLKKEYNRVYLDCKIRKYEEHK